MRATRVAEINAVIKIGIYSETNVFIKFIIHFLHTCAIH